MTRPRYLAILRGRDPFGKTRAMAARAVQLSGLKVIVKSPGLLLLAQNCPAFSYGPNAGALLGTIFPKSSRERASGIPRDKTAQALTQKGLIDAYWGDYVAFVSDQERGRMSVIRAPFGNLPCYYRDVDGSAVLASDLDLLTACSGEEPKCDWEMLGYFLAMSELRHERTCIAGVHELLGGTVMTAGEDHVHITCCWSPWTYGLSAHDHEITRERTAQLRETADRCIRAVTGQYGHVLAMLSGGLDSSIMVNCLGRSGARLSCLTLVTEDPLGDERAFARLAAKAADAPLVEAMRRLEDVDIQRSAASHLPRPVARAFAQASSRLACEVAAQTGAQAIFDGGGGDNLFCSLQSVAPVADRLLTSGPGVRAWSSACDMARLAQTSVWTVARRAMRRAWFPERAVPWRGDPRFLRSETVALAERLLGHRWLDVPGRALPGKTAHIALLAAAENQWEVPYGALPAHAPLMAQPLVELCLSIPSWCWCRDGRNRAVARIAFAGRVPQRVLDRRLKGTPAGFMAALFTLHRSTIRDMLLGGALVAKGLVDSGRLETALAGEAPFKGHDYVRIMRMVDVEAWARGV